MENMLISAAMGCLLAIGTTATFADISTKELKPHNKTNFSKTQNLPNNETKAINKSITPYIIGGEPAPINSWPYIVSIGHSRLPADLSHNCGGSLIRKDVILTAAHCVTNVFASDLSVLIGSKTLSNKYGTGKRIGVEKIVIHEYYNDETIENDIALLFLSENSTHEVLPTISADQANKLLPGEPMPVAGWGMLGPYDRTRVDQLQQVNIEYIDQQTCADAYPITDKNKVTVVESMLCAGTSEGGKDACPGDSGSPLLINIDGNKVQAGIVSWGDECGAPGSKGVYTRLSYFTDWIDQHINRYLEDYPVMDPQLARCIEEHASKSGWRSVNEVTELNCSDFDINYLDGIEAYSNIQYLNLSGNSLVDLNPLQKLNKLVDIDLSYTEINDISVLLPSQGLEIIKLLGNAAITCLNPDDGPFDYHTMANSCFELVSNIEFEDEQLKKCVAQQSKDNGTYELEGFVYLTCPHWQIQSLEGIDGLTNLKVLDIYSNKVTDLQALSQIPLEYLSVDKNPIDNWHPVSDVTSLEHFSSNDNQMTDISFLASLSKLSYLSLADNFIDDLEPISPLNKISTLVLDSNEITDISPLASMEMLEQLYIEGNDISCVDPFKGPFSYEQIAASCFNIIFADADGDNINDTKDNCPTITNSDQSDYDYDGEGDACDSDGDNDGFTNSEEIEAGSDPYDWNSTPESVVIDYDFDEVENEFDNCPVVWNQDQQDYDFDGLGDACDEDDDGDGFSDEEEESAGSDPLDASSTPDSDNEWSNFLDMLIESIWEQIEQLLSDLFS